MERDRNVGSGSDGGQKRAEHVGGHPWDLPADGKQEVEGGKGS